MEWNALKRLFCKTFRFLCEVFALVATCSANENETVCSRHRSSSIPPHKKQHRRRCVSECGVLCDRQTAAQASISSNSNGVTAKCSFTESGSAHLVCDGAYPTLTANETQIRLRIVCVHMASGSQHFMTISIAWCALQKSGSGGVNAAAGLSSTAPVNAATEEQLASIRQLHRAIQDTVSEIQGKTGRILQGMLTVLVDIIRGSKMARAFTTQLVFRLHISPSSLFGTRIA